MRHCSAWSPFADGSDPLLSMQNDRSSTVHARDCSDSPALQELAAFAGTSRRPVYFRRSPRELPPSPCPWSRFCSPGEDPPTPEPLPPDEHGGIGTKTRVLHLATPRCLSSQARTVHEDCKRTNKGTGSYQNEEDKEKTTARPFCRHTMAGFQ